MQNNNPMQMMQAFNQFRNSLQGKSAKQEVEKLMQTGQMSQAQFNQLQQQATSFQQMFNIR